MLARALGSDYMYMYTVATLYYPISTSVPRLSAARTYVQYMYTSQSRSQTYLRVGNERRTSGDETDHLRSYATEV